MATAKADATKSDSKTTNTVKSADVASNPDPVAADATSEDTGLVNSVNGLAEVRRAPNPENSKASVVLADTGSAPVVGDDDAVYADGVPGQIIRPEELPDPELQRTIGVDPDVWRRNGKVYVEGEQTPA